MGEEGRAEGNKDLFDFLLMCVGVSCVYLHTYVWVPVEARRGHAEYSWPAVTSGCEPSDVGTGNRIRVLYKNHNPLSTAKPSLQPSSSFQKSVSLLSPAFQPQ